MGQNGCYKPKLKCVQLAAFISLALAFTLMGALHAPAYAATSADTSNAQFAVASVAQTQGEGDAAGDVDADIWDGAIDTSWYQAEASQFTLSKPAQLAGLAAIVNGTADGIAKDSFNGKTVVLDADIVLNETAVTGPDESGTQRNWTGIGAGPLLGFVNGMPNYDDTVYFDGTFDGAGHVVKNIYIYKTNETGGDGTTGPTYGGYQGLFTSLGSNAVVKNVGVEGGYIYGRVVGGIAAHSHASATAVPQIIGCFNSAVIQGNGASTRGAGGIFGGEEQYRGADNYRAGAYIANCYNKGAVNSAMGSPAGGIAGAGSVQIYSCYNAGKVTSTSTYVGAIAGNLVGAGAKLGDGSSAEDGSAVVRNSYALDDVVSSGRLFNMMDATHTKDGTGDKDASVMEGDTIGFKSIAWLEGSDVASDLSQSFVAGGKLWWQDGSVTDLKDLEAYDYGSYEYEIADIASQAYTGKAITPQVSVSGFDWGSYTDVPLREGADYMVEYTDNVNVGTAHITITGIGRFTGVRTTSFQIVDGNLATAQIEPIANQWIYGEEAVTPEVVVKTSTGEKLVEGKDYTLEFVDNDKPGTATVTVKPFEGSAFTGECSATFKLVQASEKLEGAGTAEDPYKIGSKADLQFMAHQINAKIDSSYESACYEVVESFDAGANKESALAADLITSFSGTIDGKGNTITLNLSENTLSADFDNARLSAVAFIDRISGDATIKNLTLEGKVNSAASAAGFVGQVVGGTLVVDNCVNAVDVHGVQYYTGTGGFVYSIESGASALFTNCKNTGAISSDESVAAGFAGRANGSASFTDCTNEGTVTSGREAAAGFIASLPGTSKWAGTPSANILFSGCVNAGAVSTGTNNSAGGFIGTNDNPVLSLEFSKCHNDGTIDGVTSQGGFAGQLRTGATLRNCYNVGDVKAHASQSGWSGTRPPAAFVGEFSPSSASTVLAIDNVYTVGDIMAVQDYQRAAFVGQIYSGTITLNSAFYDEANADCAIGSLGYGTQNIEDNSQAMAADTMKSQAFVSMLGAAFSVAESDENGGFPVLRDRVVNDIAECSVTPSTLPAVKYDGTLSADFQLLGADSDPLEEGVDYVVFYQVEGSLGKAIIVGQGDWRGTRELTFDVEKCPISSCTVAPLASMSYADNPGGTFTQEVAVESPAGTKLVEGVDYTVSFANNDKAGTAMVLIAAKGDLYEGSAMRLFQILPGDMSQCELSGMQDNYEYQSYGPSIYATITSPSGYVLSDDWRNPEYEDAYFDAEGNEVSRTQLVPGRVTVTFTGSGNWIGSLSHEFTYGYDFAHDAVVANDGAVVEFTGKAIDFAPQVVSAATGEPINELEYSVVITNEDGVEVSAEDVIDPGVYTYTIASNNMTGAHGTYWDDDYYRYQGWFGSTTATMTIATPGYLISDECVSGVDDTYAETGEAIDVTPVVKVGDTTLVAGTNYQVAFANQKGEVVDAPVEAGTYTVIVTGIGSYAGKVVKSFTVEEPFFTVYEQVGDNVSTQHAVKAYSKAQFAALSDPSAKPVSALYFGSGTWSVATAATYVALTDLLADAGLEGEWKEGAAVSYGGDPAQGKPGQVATFERIASAMFYPATAGSATSLEGEMAAPFVISLTDSSRATSESLAAGAAELENVEEANQNKAPRVIYGISREAYLDTATYNAEVRGMRLWSDNHAITLITPAPVVKDPVENVKALIEALPNGGEATAATKAKADEAMAAFNALTPEQKQQIDIVSIIKLNVVSAMADKAAADAAKADAGKADSQNPSSADQGKKQDASQSAAKAKKAKNTIVAKAKKKVLKVKAGKSLAKAKAFKIAKARGKVTFKKISGKKKITVSKKGKVTVKKGLKKGLYKVKVKVTAAGNAKYKKGVKTVTLKIRVK